MDKLLTQLLEKIESGNYLLVAVVLFVAILFNLNNIVAFFDSRRKVKINLLDDALKNNNVNGKTKEFFVNQIETEYFKKVTGINLAKDKREKYLEIYKSAEGEIRFSHFKRAVKYLEFPGGNAEINFSLMSKITFVYNSTTALLSLFAAALVFSITFFNRSATNEDVWVLFSASGFLLVFSVALFMQCLPVISAYYVKGHIQQFCATNDED